MMQLSRLLHRVSIIQTVQLVRPSSSYMVSGTSFFWASKIHTTSDMFPTRRISYDMEQDDFSSSGSISPLQSTSDTVIITIEADSPESHGENKTASKRPAPSSAQYTNVNLRDGQIQVPTGWIEVPAEEPTDKLLEFLEEHKDMIARLLQADQPLWEEHLSVAVGRILSLPGYHREDPFPLDPSSWPPLAQLYMYYHSSILLCCKYNFTDSNFNVKYLVWLADQSCSTNNIYLLYFSLWKISIKQQLLINKGELINHKNCSWHRVALYFPVEN